MKVDIIGAGIGGLTTAIALKEKGLNVSLFEQAKEIKPVGAGIVLASNAMQVYDKLGLRSEIEASGNSISSMKVTKADLTPLSKIDLSYFEKKHKVKNIAIHRGALQQILLDKLTPTEINLHHRLSNISIRKNGHLLNFENGKSHPSSILIGADGINSMVRQHLFPTAEIRNANQICWRGLTNFDLPIGYKNELNEAWGKAGRFGFVQISESTVYWYALKTFKHHPIEFSVNEIEKYFADYHPVIKAIIASTKNEQINTTEISDLKPIHNWHKKTICLMGDAAHATTPNMGQGACQAVEDAYILSGCLQKFEPNRAFVEFQQLRLPKAHQVVKTSWFIGKMAHLPNPILRALRNQMMRLTPSSLNKKRSRQIFQLQAFDE